MTDLERAPVVDALTTGYATVTEAVERLTEAELAIPSRCAGWAVRDVLYHQLLDARRALRTFVTPGEEPVDTDAVSYWRPFAPDSGHAFALGGAEAAEHARHVRAVAAAYRPDDLRWEWRETSEAACRAARTCPHDTVSTQGHVLTTTDFVATLAVESAVHFLDLAWGLPAPPPPDQASLALVRRVLDGLLGTAVPAAWDDSTYALKGTGRLALTRPERTTLGPLADRFPLFG